MARADRQGEKFPVILCAISVVRADGRGVRSHESKAGKNLWSEVARQDWITGRSTLVTIAGCSAYVPWLGIPRWGRIHFGCPAMPVIQKFFLALTLGALCSQTHALVE